MPYRKIGITPSTPEPRAASRIARYVRVAGMIGLLLMVTACTADSLVTYPALGSGSCRGVAGMEVPNCDFTRPPSY